MITAEMLAMVFVAALAVVLWVCACIALASGLERRDPDETAEDRDIRNHPERRDD